MNGLASSGPLIRSGTTNRRVKINVGGKIFETTAATLQSAGKSSLLAGSAPSLPSDSAEIFFDRDPRLFSLLLALLRTGKLPGTWKSFDLDALIEEAIYYGVLDLLRAALFPSTLDGLDIDRVEMVVPNGRDFPSALSGGADGSMWVGHGSKITAYDWALRKQTTTLTELHRVETLHRIADSRAAVGAEDFPGLHIYDTMKGTHVKSIVWSDRNDTRVYRTCVRSITSSKSAVFASFETGQRSDNTILMVDKESLQIMKEIGRESGRSAHSKVATKLQYVGSKDLLMAVGVHGGTFGYSGYIRLWDVRADKIVWEWTEPNSNSDARVMERDSFADVTVNEDLAGIFKVSVITGNLAMADLRHLKPQDPWMHMTETNPALAVDGGRADAKLLGYGKQIFCSRGGDLEVWSEVPLVTASAGLNEKEYWETSFRRNFIEHSRRHAGQEVTALAAGGDRLFVAREEMQGVEVWETRHLVSSEVSL
ncbi:hypothetical protein KI387_025156 [Taxus chinensis]|uniref:BTB domain-containing protein n=1 Tax=Taxus chinensis TaxID=29808 RepID=A0AA38G8R8_TAXCH|nr:hypothetical protein KI387_025156 [Taxus chinensis]